MKNKSYVCRLSRVSTRFVKCFSAVCVPNLPDFTAFADTSTKGIMPLTIELAFSRKDANMVAISVLASHTITSTLQLTRGRGRKVHQFLCYNLVRCNNQHVCFWAVAAQVSHIDRWCQHMLMHADILGGQHCWHMHEDVVVLVHPLVVQAAIDVEWEFCRAVSLVDGVLKLNEAANTNV